MFCGNHATFLTALYCEDYRVFSCQQWLFLTQVLLPDNILVPVGEELGHLDLEAPAPGSGSVLEEGAAVFAALGRSVGRGPGEDGSRPFLGVPLMTSAQKGPGGEGFKKYLKFADKQSSSGKKNKRAVVVQLYNNHCLQTVHKLTRKRRGGGLKKSHNFVNVIYGRRPLEGVRPRRPDDEVRHPLRLAPVEEALVSVRRKFIGFLGGRHFETLKRVSGRASYISLRKQRKLRSFRDQFNVTMRNQH